MRKELFFSAAMGAMLLTGCTSEEVVDVGVLGNAIRFETVVNKSTRADEMSNVDIDKENFTQFFVYGYYTMNQTDEEGNASETVVPVFNGDPVSRGSSDWTWSYTGEDRFWVPNGNYYFYAYSCGNKPLAEQYGGTNIKMDLAGATRKERVLKLFGYVCNDNHQHDLIFASRGPITGADPKTAAGNTDPQHPGFGNVNEKVEFKFSHILTKVNALFENQYPSDYSVVISDVRLMDVLDKGDYSPNADEGWSNQSYTQDDNPQIVSLAIDPDNSTEHGKTVTTNWGFVLPADYTSNANVTTPVTLKFKMDVYKGGVKILTRTISGSFKPTWRDGYTYTYKVTINGSSTTLDKIEFTVNESDPVNGWSSEANVITGIQYHVDEN